MAHNTHNSILRRAKRLRTPENCSRRAMEIQGQIHGRIDESAAAAWLKIQGEGCAMKIVISGGLGLVGSALTNSLRAAGHEVSHLVRPGGAMKQGDVHWDPGAATVDMAALEGAQAVVHLSGASIADGRWTPSRKAVLRSSRIDTTRVLVDAILHLRQQPRVFVCASAVGYYGDRGEEILAESSSYGTDFLALLARDWEAEAMRAEHGGIRTVMLRFGVIFDVNGGALPKMLAPLRWGVGGRFGTGRQWMSWVTLEDAVEVAQRAIMDGKYGGPVNVVAPDSVRNADFTRIAAAELHRPAIFPAPAFALRLMLGEMAQPLLLASQRVKPQRLIEFGYEFRNDKIKPTLRKMIGDKRGAKL